MDAARGRVPASARLTDEHGNAAPLRFLPAPPLWSNKVLVSILQSIKYNSSKHANSGESVRCMFNCQIKWLTCDAPGEADGMLHAQNIFKHSGNSLFCVVTGNNLVGLFYHKQGASAADLKQRKSKQTRKRNHRSMTAETLFHPCWVFYRAAKHILYQVASDWPISWVL